METLSVNQLLHQLAPFRIEILSWILAVPLMAWLGGRLLRPLSRRLSAWYLSFAVYVTVVPGMLVGAAVGYLFFFTGTNMVNDLDVVLHFGPVFSMVATLVAATRVLPATEIPGMKRVGGLFLAGTVVSGVFFALSRTSIFTFVHVGERGLFTIALGVIFLTWVGFTMVFGEGAEEEPDLALRTSRR